MDITTKADALKVLSDLTAEQKRLSDSNRDLATNLESKSADLKLVQQKLAEMAAPSVVTVSEKEATLRRFVGADGSLDVAGMASDETDRGEWHSEFKRLVDDRNLAKIMTKSGNVPKLDAKLEMHMTSAPSDIRRAFSDAAGLGSDWIPDNMLPELAKKLYVTGAVESLFPTMTLQSKELRLPVLNTQVRPYYKNGATWGTITAQDDVASQISVTAKSFGARISVDEDASADAIVAGLDFVRNSLSDALSAAIEDCILSGDETAAHLDLNTVASPRAFNPASRWNAGHGAINDHRRAFDGLRSLANDASTTRDAVAMTYADIMATRGQMSGAHGVSDKVAMIVSPEVMVMHLLGLDQVATIDKIGDRATVNTGSLAMLAGAPIVVSSLMPSNLAATGYYTGSGTRTGYLLVDTARYFMANYKPLTIDLQREITQGIIEIVGTRRTALASYDASTVKNVAYGINVASV